MTWQTLLWYHCCHIWTDHTPSAIVLVYTFKKRSGCSVNVHLIFKIVRRNEKVYIKCKSENYPRQIQHRVIDLKMRLLVKIVNDFKLYSPVPNNRGREGLNKRGKTDKLNINKWEVHIKGGRVWKTFLVKRGNPLSLVMCVPNKIFLLHI